MNQAIENFAAIDIGTNSFHLIVVKVKANGNFEIIDREKEVIRLGEGSSNDIKEIRPEAAAADLVEKSSPRLKRVFARAIARMRNAVLGKPEPPQAQPVPIPRSPEHAIAEPPT